MRFKYILSPRAEQNLDELIADPGMHIVLKAVNKALDLLETNPFHPSLRSKLYNEAEKIYESSAQNNTPSAYRIFWHYGPERKVITVTAIVPHP